MLFTNLIVSDGMAKTSQKLQQRVKQHKRDSKLKPNLRAINSHVNNFNH